MASLFTERKHRTGGLIVALVGIALLAACGGATVPPTANDTATVAALRAATASVAPGTIGPGTAASTSGGNRGFGGLLTPAATARTTTGGTGASGTGTSGTAAPRGTGTAAVAGAVGATSPQSAPLDPCTLASPADLSRTMGEPFSKYDSDAESPVSQVRGYSAASCIFAATGSSQTDTRAVIIETIRRTPATAVPSGSGVFRNVTELWAYLKQQAPKTGSNVAPVGGVGDEAIAFDDNDNPGDVNVYVRKGEVLLHIVISGYGKDARDKAIAVATQAAMGL